MHQKKKKKMRAKGWPGANSWTELNVHAALFFLKMTRHKRFSKYRSKGHQRNSRVKHLKAFVKKLKSVKIRSQDPALKC